MELRHLKRIAEVVSHVLAVASLVAGGLVVPGVTAMG
jgi:hypothetical protein